MASTAKVLSSSSFQVAPRTVELREVPPPAASDGSGALQLLRDFGGVLVIAAALALWTATWAAIEARI